MKTRIDHLLACVGEECGEIQQIIGKSIRFGLFDCHPVTKEVNLDALEREIHDLIAVYELLRGCVGGNRALRDTLLEKKKKRVLHYMEYARERGELEKAL